MTPIEIGLVVLVLAVVAALVFTHKTSVKAAVSTAVADLQTKAVATLAQAHTELANVSSTAHAAIVATATGAPSLPGNQNQVATPATVAAAIAASPAQPAVPVVSPVSETIVSDILARWQAAGGTGVVDRVSAMQSPGDGRIAFIVPGISPPNVVWQDPDPNQAASDAKARADKAARVSTIGPGSRTLAQFWAAILSTGPSNPAMFAALSAATGEVSATGATPPKAAQALQDASGDPFVAAIQWMRQGSGNKPGAGATWSLADLDAVRGLLASVGA